MTSIRLASSCIAIGLWIVVAASGCGSDDPAGPGTGGSGMSSGGRGGASAGTAAAAAA